MEKFREIEVDLQNAIDEASRVSTLFEYYLERNEYHKELEDSLFAQRDKLQAELNELKSDYSLVVTENKKLKYEKDKKKN